MHTHICDDCGNKWSHDETYKGDVLAHTCTVCGRRQWWKAECAIPKEERDWLDEFFGFKFDQQQYESPVRQEF